MSSATSKHRARQNLRLHSSLQLEALGQGPGARRQFTLVANAPWLLEPLPNWCRTTFCRLVPTGLSFLTGSEGVVSGILFRRDLRGLRLAFHGPGEGFLGGAIVEVLDLLIILGFPMDEHANGDEEIVGLVGRNYAFGNGVGNRLGYGMLRRTEHLHRLARVLDGHLVVKDRGGLTHKVRRDQRE